MHSILNGTEKDDRYLFLQDLYHYTQRGVCDWECIECASDRVYPGAWVVTSNIQGKKIHLSTNMVDTPPSCSRCGLYGPRCYVVKYPGGSFLVYNSVADKLCFDKLESILNIVGFLAPQEERLSEVVKNLFREDIHQMTSYELVNAIQEDTAYSSNSQDIVLHPWFKVLVKKGRDILPELMSMINEDMLRLVVCLALKEITKAQVMVPLEDKGRIDVLVEQWKLWYAGRGL